MGCPRPNTPRSNPYDLGELERDLRDRLWTLFTDAPTHGLTLVSGYRDPGRQWDLRTPDRGIPVGHQCDPAYPGHPATAVPAQLVNGQWVGGSHHQHRKAADIGGRELQWAIDNRARYGLGLTVRTEDWHFETQGVDRHSGRTIPAPTVRILSYPGPCWDDPTTQPEEPLMVNADDEKKIRTIVREEVAAAVQDAVKAALSPVAATLARGGEVRDAVVSIKRHAVTGADAAKDDDTVPERELAALARIEQAVGHLADKG